MKNNIACGANTPYNKTVRNFAAWTEPDLIPCTPALERLKIFWRIRSQFITNAKASRIRVAKFYEGRPPYDEKELMNTAYAGEENRENWLAYTAGRL
jgi:hypothetical protein